MTRHKKKVLFITVGVLMFVALAGSFALLLNIQAFTPQVEAAASAALGLEVRIKGGMSLVFFPGFGLSLKGVTVENKAVDVVTIEKISVGLQLISLARFQIRIMRVGLVRPVFSIVRLKNGRFNFETPDRALWGKLLPVKKISITEASLVYSDETSDEKIEAGDLDVSISDLIFSGTDSSEFFKSISFTGDAQCRILKIHNITLMNLEMRAAGAKGIFDVDPIRMNIFDGTGSASVHVDMTGSSPHYKVIHTLDRARIEELIQLYAFKPDPQKTLEGPINFSADLTAMGKSADEVKRSLNGTIALNGENLILHDIDIDAFVMKYERSQNLNLVDVGAFLLVGPLGPVLTRSYNFINLYQASRGGNGIIRKLVSVWRLNNGIAEGHDVALASKKQRIALKGRVNIINERFVDITIAALDKRGCAVFSEKVHGPFRKPQIEKDSIFKSIVGSVLNPLEDAWKSIQGEECAVFYSGSVPQPEE